MISMSDDPKTWSHWSYLVSLGLTGLIFVAPVSLGLSSLKYQIS